METVCSEPYIEKGSKFFGYFVRTTNIEDFKIFMQQLKKDHKKARHICYAYIIDKKEKYSNDGEPVGCGNTLLTLLKTNKIENSAIIVVRYFGGVLLGSGNLIRAYLAAGKNAFNAK